MRDTGLADRLRAAGLRVVEMDGWQTHGDDSFNPAGSVNHHTAGPATGTAPSLDTVYWGRSDLEGPLANVLQSRETSGDDIAYVVAAGRANHAGSGGWAGLSGNSSVWGLEIEHTGVDPLPEHRQRIAARIHAAMFGGDPSMLCQHSEWAPDRKIDAATGVDADGFRDLYADARAGHIQGELLMTDDQLRAFICLCYSAFLRRWPPDNEREWYLGQVKAYGLYNFLLGFLNKAGAEPWIIGPANFEWAPIHWQELYDLAPEGVTLAGPTATGEPVEETSQDLPPAVPADVD